MRLPEVWDGKEWRYATMEEYNNELINIPVYGKANYVFRDVWELPVVNTDMTTGSKVVKCGRTIQFRFSCARTTTTAQIVRAYKLALDKDDRAGVRFNYQKVGATFNFETTFCGSASGLKKFQSFVERIATLSSVKSIYVRVRDERTGETSNFKKFLYNNLIINVARYLRDNLDIKGYNKVKINKLEVIPDNSIYGVKVIL